MSVAMEGIGKGSMNRLNPKKYKKIYHQSKILTLDSDATVRRFQTPDVLEELNGAILSIRPEQQQYRDDEDDDRRPTSRAKRAPNVNPSVNPVIVVEETPEEDVDIFARNLNWATTENPDGVAIVHDPFDQVRVPFCARVRTCWITSHFATFASPIGVMWGLLGICCHRVVGSVGVASGRVQRLQDVREATSVVDLLGGRR
jgi:hypothetical protein